MNIDRENRKKNFLTACIYISILSISFDTGSYIPWDFIKIKNISASVIGNTVISLQVTLVSTSIAIVAILSGLTNKKIYSKSVTEFITKDQPLVFKHRNIITALISLILANYILWVKGFYNCEVAVFIISLFLVLIMCWDIFGVFYGEKNIKEQIKNFLLENYDNEYLIDLESDIHHYITINNTLKMQENFDILESILIKTIASNDSENYNKVERIIVSSYINLLNSCEKNKIILAILQISNLYKKVASKKEVLIFEKCDDAFYKSLKYLSFDDLIQSDYNGNILSSKKSLISELHDKLCLNIIFDNNNRPSPLKIRTISFFTYFVYGYLFASQNKLVDNEPNNYKVSLYLNLYFKLIKNVPGFNYYVKVLIYNELLEYTKILIDNVDIEIFQKTFFEIYIKLTTCFNSLDYQYVTSIYIYLFYLIEYKDEDEFSFSNKQILKRVINQESNLSNNFFHNNKFFDYKPELKNYLNNLSQWEMISIEKIPKKFMLRNVIEDILIFIILAEDVKYNIYFENLNSIIGNHRIIFLHKFFIPNDSYIRTHFKNFYTLYINDNLSDIELNNKLDILKSFLSNN